MRILVAEDELLERKAMKKFIEATFSDMQVVGEAVNGRQAIELAERTNPDIVFMDIKMPGIDGLEAIKHINARDDSIRFILVSAYDSFDYAKQAMHYGIRDYILKPGKKEEIVKALLRIKKGIVKEAEVQAEKSQSEQLRKGRLLADLMKQPLSNETRQLQTQVFPDMESGCFLVVSSATGYSVEHVEHSLASSLDAAFMMDENTECLTICIIAKQTLTKKDLLKMARQLHIDLGHDLFIGIGYPSTSLEGLSHSYQSAYTACFQLKSDNKSRYGFVQKEQATDRTDDIITQVCDQIEHVHSEEAMAYFAEKQHLLAEFDRETLYISMKNLLADHRASWPDMSLSTLKTGPDWIAFLKLCSMNLYEVYLSRQHMLKVKHYIEAHFQEAISLEAVAEFVDLSPNYVSNLFKQAYGETFIDYLTKIRLQEAKHLLQENGYSLKEISYMIGYNDPNYFSRVFKKHYDVSPRQFQQAIFKK